MGTEAQEENRTEWSLDDEFQENRNLSRSDIETLKDFCSSLPSSATFTITDELMVAFLHSNEYNLEQAQTSASKYFEIRANSPEVFKNREIDGDIQSGLESVYFCPLPRKTPEGYKIILQKMRRSEVHAFQHGPASKLQFLTIDALIHEDPTCPGYIFLCDTRGVSLGHLFKSSLFLTRKLLRYAQEGVPVKIHLLAVIYASHLSEKILRLMKPFMSKDMLDLIKFYTEEQMDEFWEILPKEYFPQDYDGGLSDFETLHQNQINWLRRMQPKVDSPNTSR